MVDFPINSMVDLSIVFCVSLPGRVQKKTSESSESSESLTIINHYQSSPFSSWLRTPPTSIVINHHSSLSIIINHL